MFCCLRQLVFVILISMLWFMESKSQKHFYQYLRIQKVNTVLKFLQNLATLD